MYILCNYKSLPGSAIHLLRKELGVLGSSLTLLTRRQLHSLKLPETFTRTFMISLPPGKFSCIEPILQKWDLLEVCFFDGKNLSLVTGPIGRAVKVSLLLTTMKHFSILKTLSVLRTPFIGATCKFFLNKNKK